MVVEETSCLIYALNLVIINKTLKFTVYSKMRLKYVVTLIARVVHYLMQYTRGTREYYTGMHSNLCQFVESQHVPKGVLQLILSRKPPITIHDEGDVARDVATL